MVLLKNLEMCLNRLTGAVRQNCKRITELEENRKNSSGTMDLVVYDNDTGIIDNVETKNIIMTFDRPSRCMVQMFSDSFMMAATKNDLNSSGMIGIWSVNDKIFPVLPNPQSNVLESCKFDPLVPGLNIQDCLVAIENLLDNSVSLPVFSTEEMKVSNNFQSNDMDDNMKILMISTEIDKFSSTGLMLFTQSPLLLDFGIQLEGKRLGMATTGLNFLISKI